MTLNYQAAFDLNAFDDGTGTFSVDVSDGTNTFTVDADDIIAEGPGSAQQTTYIYHRGPKPGSGDGTIQDFVHNFWRALETGKSSATPSAITQEYTVTFPHEDDTAADYLKLTIAVDSGQIQLTPANETTQKLLGQVSTSLVSSIIGTVIPWFVLSPTLSARSEVSDEYEPDELGSLAIPDEVTNDSPPVGIARTSSPVYADWLQQFESKELTFKNYAASSAPFTFQHLIENCRTTLPFCVLDSNVSDHIGGEEFWCFLRPESSNFRPRRVQVDYDGHWHVPFETIVWQHRLPDPLELFGPELLVWAKATADDLTLSGTDVTDWTNRADGADGSQSVSASQPSWIASSPAMGGHGVVSFDSADDWIEFDAAGVALRGEQFSMVIAARRRSDSSTTYQTLWSFGLAAGGSDFWIFRSEQTTNDAQDIYEDSVSERDAMSYSPSTLQNARVYGTLWDGTTGFQYRENTLENSAEMSGSGFAPDRFTIGATGMDTETTPGDWDVAEFALVRRTATDRERDLLVRYIAQDKGISV